MNQLKQDLQQLCEELNINNEFITSDAAIDFIQTDEHKNIITNETANEIEAQFMKANKFIDSVKYNQEDATISIYIDRDKLRQLSHK